MANPSLSQALARARQWAELEASGVVERSDGLGADVRAVLAHLDALADGANAHVLALDGWLRGTDEAYLVDTTADDLRALLAPEPLESEVGHG